MKYYEKEFVEVAKHFNMVHIEESEKGEVVVLSSASILSESHFLGIGNRRQDCGEEI